MDRSTAWKQKGGSSRFEEFVRDMYATAQADAERERIEKEDDETMQSQEDGNGEGKGKDEGNGKGKGKGKGKERESVAPRTTVTRGAAKRKADQVEASGSSTPLDQGVPSKSDRVHKKIKITIPRTLHPKAPTVPAKIPTKIPPKARQQQEELLVSHRFTCEVFFDQYR